MPRDHALALEGRLAIAPVQQKAGHSLGIQHPDAHLIAAAPELLAACEAMLEHLEDAPLRDLRDGHGELTDALRAAIAKARGTP